MRGGEARRVTVQVTDTIDFRGQGVIEADSVDVGFFSTARYDTGERVVEVAARNEFGDRRVPERPFMRNALSTIANGLLRDLAEEISSGQRIAFTREDANRIGAMAAGEIQDEIVNLREPPNSPETIRRKNSDNPLVDTGFLRQSVDWKVRDAT